MLRTALLLSSLFAAACTVGELPKNNGGTTDAGNGSNMIDAAAGNGCSDRDPAPAAAYVHSAGAGGGTHAGDACMPCHAQGGTGPQFQIAGTVYKADGTTANAGVWVRLKPAAGGTGGAAITDTAGNFRLSAGTVPMAFPALTETSVCPTVTPMSGQLAANGGGNCNASGCHLRGGAQGVIKLSP